MVLKLSSRFLVVAHFVLFSSASMAQEKPSFVISSPQTNAQVVLNEKEAQLVSMAAKLFSGDVQNITGKSLELKSAVNSAYQKGNSPYQIKVGTVHVSED